MIIHLFPSAYHLTIENERSKTENHKLEWVPNTGHRPYDIFHQSHRL
jgi:hypothetical protein